MREFEEEQAYLKPSASLSDVRVKGSGCKARCERFVDIISSVSQCMERERHCGIFRDGMVRVESCLCERYSVNQVSRANHCRCIPPIFARQHRFEKECRSLVQGIVVVWGEIAEMLRSLHHSQSVVELVEFRLGIPNVIIREQSLEQIGPSNEIGIKSYNEI